jgi:hypothetical protein
VRCAVAAGEAGVEQPPLQVARVESADVAALLEQLAGGDALRVLGTAGLRVRRLQVGSCAALAGARRRLRVGVGRWVGRLLSGASWAPTAAQG